MEWDLFGLITISRELGRIDGRLHKIETTLQERFDKMDTAWQTVIDKVAGESTKIDSITTLLAELRKAPTIEEVRALIDNLTANDAKLDAAIGPKTTV